MEDRKQETQLRTMTVDEQNCEITNASLREVWDFFREATRIDHQGIDLAILGGDRLSECDEAFVAKQQGIVIGAVTMAVSKGRPTLSTLYVFRAYRRKGVAYLLCKTALLRFEQTGVKEVFCDVQSDGMKAVLDRLGREHPELRGLVRESIGYLPGDDIELGLDEELPDLDCSDGESTRGVSQPG